MNRVPIEQARDSDLRLSKVALERAARRARELAARTGTALIVSRKGMIERREAGSEEAATDLAPGDGATP
jgi:hypothetical protein